MHKIASALGSALALAGFIGVTFCAPLAGIFSQPGAWYVALNKPSWNPPAWIFGPAWTLLYTLMAIAAWQIWKRDGCETEMAGRLPRMHHGFHVSMQRPAGPFWQAVS